MQAVGLNLYFYEAHKSIAARRLCFTAVAMINNPQPCRHFSFLFKMFLLLSTSPTLTLTGQPCGFWDILSKWNILDRARTFMACIEWMEYADRLSLVIMEICLGFYEKSSPQTVASECCPHRGTVLSWLCPSMSMSSRVWCPVVAPALTPLSPEPSGLSQLLPGDELRVRDRDDNFHGSGRARAGVGRGRGANSNVLGRSRVPVWDSEDGGGLRRCTAG